MIKIGKKTRIIGMTIIILGVAFFIFYNLYTRWNELKQYTFSFDSPYLFAFIILIILFYFLTPIIWSFSLRLFGERVSYKKILKVWHSAQLIRYIPGNIAFVLGRTEAGKKEGIPRTKNLIATSLELALIVIACLTIFLGYILFSATNIGWLIFLLIPIGLIILHPRIFIPIINFGLKLIKKPEIENKIKYKKILVLFLIVLIIQLIEGFAYAFLLKTIFNYSLSFIELLKFAAIYEGAWVIGFLSFLTPSGIGVREAALSLLLSLYMPLTIAIIFSIFARICCIILEVIIAITILGYNKIKK